MAFRPRVALVLACTALLSRHSPATAQAPEFPIVTYLRDSIGLTAGQIEDARRGLIVVKILPNVSSRDVTVFGIIGVHTSRDTYLARLDNLPQLVATRSQRFGIIADPVDPDNVRGISVDASEYKSLRDCTPNDCKFKLPVSSMRDFAQHVHWNGPNAHAEVDSLLRLDVMRFVNAYRVTGNAAMVRYDDTRGVESRDAFADLLTQSPYMREYAPELRDFLAKYPAERPAGARDVIYWSEDRIPHLRPTFTLNHLVLYTLPSGTPLVARKQLYANHYFEAAFELLSVFDAPVLPEGPGIFLVSVRRYRFDNLPSGGFLNIGGRVRSRLVTLMRSDLEREKAAVQAK